MIERNSFIPAERALGLRFVVDLVNEVPAGEPGAAAERWQRILAEHSGGEHPTERPGANEVLEATRQLRAFFSLRELADVAAAVNPLLELAGARPRFVEVRPGSWALRADPAPGSGAIQRVLTGAAFALASWAAEHGRTAWGICAADDCERVFIDEARRVPQRFCSPTCATRSRVRAHRAKPVQPE